MILLIGKSSANSFATSLNDLTMLPFFYKIIMTHPIQSYIEDVEQATQRAICSFIWTHKHLRSLAALELLDDSIQLIWRRLMPGSICSFLSVLGQTQRCMMRKRLSRIVLLHLKDTVDILSWVLLSLMCGLIVVVAGLVWKRERLLLLVLAEPCHWFGRIHHCHD